MSKSATAVSGPDTFDVSLLLLCSTGSRARITLLTPCGWGVKLFSALACRHCSQTQWTQQLPDNHFVNRVLHGEMACCIASPINLFQSFFSGVKSCWWCSFSSYMGMPKVSALAGTRRRRFSKAPRLCSAHSRPCVWGPEPRVWHCGRVGICRYILAYAAQLTCQPQGHPWPGPLPKATMELAVPCCRAHRKHLLIPMVTIGRRRGRAT